ncbi:choline-sulfatase [Deinococcus peraridilitoris]|uniref:Choline-sulfatase n=1 Tax=Deinococcus peraridilitoris (strain DSM 19664 / LMG 22246 / CIP 109416 / KR-200) TaxID=937777 RepID=K9ZVV3_DEIPD|nr:choline-sulfatase [Deinococcus peraridilitoris]AFZ65666.1 choline-sulfatase [Deinococcus peraridilitoris DSM 19664]
MIRPNILLIVVDQMAHDVIARLGHPAVLTPHLNALVTRGVTFTSAHCNSPICVSSRTALMTGLLVRDNGAFDNGSEFPASIPTFAHHLNRAGYTTILSGKMHFVGPDQLHGFQERLTADISPCGFELTPDWTQGPVANEGTSVNRLRYPPVRPWSLQLSYDDEVLHSALVRLRQLREETPPFFMCVSFSHPHDPFLVPQSYWDAYAQRDIPLPSTPAEDPGSLHPYSQWIQKHHEIDRFPLSPAETLQARRAYYAAVTYVDELVGQLLAELSRLDLDDTMVIFTSDHGEMLGEHGMWFKRTFYDGAVKVPLIISHPSVRQNVIRPEAVSLVDLTATLLEYGDVPDAHAHIERLAGNSLRPLLETADGAWSQRVISEYYSEGTVEPMLLLRTERYKFVYVHQYPPLLFDLQHDPLELHDVAFQEQYQPVVTALQDELLAGLDVNALRERILRSQQERLLIVAATRAPNAWKYQSVRDASRLYPRAMS